MNKKLKFFISFLAFAALANLFLSTKGTAAIKKTPPLGVLIIPFSDSRGIPKSPPENFEPATKSLANIQKKPLTLGANPTLFPTRSSHASKPLGVLLIDKQQKNASSHLQKTQPFFSPFSKKSIFSQPSKPEPALFGASKTKPLGLLLGQKIRSRPTKDPNQNIQLDRQLEQIKKREFKLSSERSAPNAVDFSADELSHDKDLGIVTARGRVKLNKENQKLSADVVSYNQKTGIVTASGNVVFDDQSGHRIFADYTEVTGDLKNGIVENIGILLKDRSRLAAAGARRSGGRILEMERGVYSPCNLCPDDPSMSPLWQIKAVKIIHDQKEQTIEYRDAWLEVSGVPVLYTPFFLHPDPTVKRKTGFLFPTFNSTSKLGFVVKSPFFWAISPYKDATITPIITSNEGSGFIGEYRDRDEKSTLDSNVSMVLGDSQESIRANLDARKEFIINENWKWGAHVQTSTDDTYLRRYRIQTSDNYLSRYGGAASNSLVSHVFTEGISDKSYFSANGYLFQDQTAATDPGTIPLILPLINYHHFGDIDQFGGYTTLDVNMLNLHRDHGADLQRLSFRPSWNRPIQGSYGDIYKYSIAVDADFYHSQDYVRDDGTKYSSLDYRMFPRTTLEGRLPLVLEGKRASQILEPIFAAMWSPNGGNPSDIPNEDSEEVEFDDTNLFSANRFTGIDRVEGGARLSYGVKWGIYGRTGGSASFLIGQSYREQDDSTFGVGSGLEENFSDIVSRVQISPGKNISLFYRTRFSPDNLSPQHNELKVTAGVPALMVSSNYIFLDQLEGSEFSGREEISGNISSQITENWSADLHARQDIRQKELRSLGLGVEYENECVKLRINGNRSFFEDRDIEPEDTIAFNVILKTLSDRENR